MVKSCRLNVMAESEKGANKNLNFFAEYQIIVIMSDQR